MFLTICQASNNGRKLSANNKNKCYHFYLLCWFLICCLGQYCSLRNWRGLRSRWKSGHQTWYRRFHPNSAPKKSDHNRKTFSSHSRHNPIFLIKLIFVVGIPMRLGCFADSFFDIGQINQHFLKIPGWSRTIESANHIFLLQKSTPERDKRRKLWIRLQQISVLFFQAIQRDTCFA